MSGHESPPKRELPWTDVTEVRVRIRGRSVITRVARLIPRKCPILSWLRTQEPQVAGFPPALE